LLCKEIIVVKSIERKTGRSYSRQILQTLLRKILAKKGLFSNDNDDNVDQVKELGMDLTCSIHMAAEIHVENLSLGI
jgi:hypothetical protein